LAGALLTFCEAAVETPGNVPGAAHLRPPRPEANFRRSLYFCHAGRGCPGSGRGFGVATSIMGDCHSLSVPNAMGHGSNNCRSSGLEQRVGIEGGRTRFLEAGSGGRTRFLEAGSGGRTQFGRSDAVRAVARAAQRSVLDYFWERPFSAAVGEFRVVPWCGTCAQR